MKKKVKSRNPYANMLGRGPFKNKLVPDKRRKLMEKSLKNETKATEEKEVQEE